MVEKKYNSSTLAGPSKKWIWMMEYCRKTGLPPAQQWAWDMAKKAWDNKGPKQCTGKTSS